LSEIHAYICADNPGAADELLDDLESACEKFGRHPGMGASCEHLMPGLRHFPVRKTYVIFYRRNADDIEIVRIVHGHRDFIALFDT
jgi:toxin ParE1/3/4